MLLYLAPLQAAVVPNLYQATVPLASNDPKTQEAATQAGLALVLVKVSGNSQITQSPIISAALKKPDRYVQSFRTITNSQAKIDFDPTTVNQLIQQAHETVWSTSRPAVVFWLTIDRGQGAALMGSSMTDPVITAIITQASVRGLPVLFPMLDLQDLNAVNVSDVTQKNINVIQSASSRYAGDAELIGQVSQTNSTWMGTWTLVLNNKPEIDWNTQAPDLTTLMTGLVNDITNNLVAQSNSPSNPSENSVMLYVSPVKSLDTYARILNYVNGLGPVKNTQVIEQNGDQIKIEITAEGGAMAVQQALASSHVLIPIVGQSTDPTMPQGPVQSTSDLHYQWTEQ